MDKAKAGEIALSATESFQRIVLGFLPGGHVIDEFLNFRNNLKQQRVLKFSENVKKALEELTDEEIDESNFTSEDFVDIVEMIFTKVQNTKSEYKLERFRNILVKQLIDPQPEMDMIFKYVKLLDELNDVQIHILDDFRFWQGQKIISIIVAYEGEDGPKYKDDYIIKRISEKVGYDVSKSETEYFANELVSLGLVRNDSRVITAMGASSPQNNFQITQIGKRFLEFIEAE